MSQVPKIPHDLVYMIPTVGRFNFEVRSSLMLYNCLAYLVDYVIHHDVQWAMPWHLVFQLHLTTIRNKKRQRSRRLRMRWREWMKWEILGLIPLTYMWMHAVSSIMTTSLHVTVMSHVTLNQGAHRLSTVEPCLTNTLVRQKPFLNERLCPAP